MEDVPGARAPASRHRERSARAPLEHWLALTLAAATGPSTCRRLARAFADPVALGACLSAALGPDRIDARAARERLGGERGPLSPAHLAALGTSATRRRVETALDWAGEEAENHLVPIDDPDYPFALRQIADPPPLLYLRGAREALRGPAVAVIGARRATHAGRERAHAIARDLAAAGIVVVSGLALGSDAAAHAGALAGRGLTLAFTGTGVDTVYPRRHAALARALLDRGGAMASEFPLGHAPQPWCFPQRNRLISGASLAVVVIEAALPSGSLTTSRHALEQGRDVMAVPGAVDNPQSRGCHALIRDGAALVTDAADVLQLLAAPLARALAESDANTGFRYPGSGGVGPVVHRPSGGTPVRGEPRADPAAGLDDSGPDHGDGDPDENGTVLGSDVARRDPAEREVWSLLESGPASLDRLVSRGSLSVPELLGALSVLELDGLVVPESGGRYARRARAPAAHSRS